MGNYTYCGDHFIMDTPETNIMYVNYTSIKKYQKLINMPAF